MFFGQMDCMYLFLVFSWNVDIYSKRMMFIELGCSYEIYNKINYVCQHYLSLLTHIGIPKCTQHQ